MILLLEGVHTLVLILLRQPRLQGRRKTIPGGRFAFGRHIGGSLDPEQVAVCPRSTQSRDVLGVDTGNALVHCLC